MSNRPDTSHKYRIVSPPINQEEFDACLASLSKAQREILLMELKGLVVDQIADARDCTTNVVYKRRAEAYRRFKFEKKPGSYYNEYRQKIFQIFQQYASEELRQEIWGDCPDALSTRGIYVIREHLETRILQTTFQPGSLLRLRGPKHVGKTLLHLRILAQLPIQDYRRVTLSFKWADHHTFENLGVFLRWFCAVVSRELGLENRVREIWDDDLSHNYNTTCYFETCILQALDTPLVLALDDMDLVFDHKVIAKDFCMLLRTWNEQAKKGIRMSHQWQKLRLWIVHSTEKYAELDINSSPLANVGEVVSIGEFRAAQVEELARQNQVEWTSEQTTKLMYWVGGHPGLVQVTFDHLKLGTAFKEIVQNAPTESSIYTSYLREQLELLQQMPELAQAFKRVVESPDPIRVNPNASFQLQSMGLTTLNGDLSAPCNQLYRQYFRNRL